MTAPGEIEALLARRDDLRARREEAQRQLAAREARDEALAREHERQLRQIERNDTAYRRHRATVALLRYDIDEARFRNATLRHLHYGPPCDIAEPPREIPAILHGRFTLDGRIPVTERYFDRTYPANHPLIYTDAEIDSCLDRIAHGETSVYGGLDRHLMAALARYPVAGKSVVNVGSTSTWCESVCLHHGALPTTIDYNPIVSLSPRLRTMTVAQWEASGERFDAALSISSFEHDGLGSYGDPLDPDGDLKAMRRMKQIVKPGGLMFLNVPTGPDLLAWNSHRVYGPIRRPMLLEGWTLMDSFGLEPQFLDGTADGEPLYVLRND
jgi:hypothetical protein